MRGKSNRGWEESFLSHYSKTRNFLEACDKACVPSKTVRDRREKDKEFAARCQDCLEAYEESMRGMVNDERDKPNRSAFFIVNAAKAVLPEWRDEPQQINLNTTVNVTPGEKTDLFSKIERGRKAVAK